MRLTKHQRLARGLKALFKNLDAFYHSVAIQLDVLQFHFFEKHLIAGRPKMNARALQCMMHTHRCGLKHFSLNKELRNACTSKPLIGLIVTPPAYSDSRICKEVSNIHWFVPWGVRIQLPSDMMTLLDHAKNEALLYAPSKAEMTDWFDWYDKEDRSTTFVNQFLIRYFEKKKQGSKNELTQENVSLKMRWQSGLSIDRQTYSSFLKYFARRFMENPLIHKVDGEIVLLIWIMTYLAQDPELPWSVKGFLTLTTENVRRKSLSINGNDIEISYGLEDLLKAYLGGHLPEERHQKLFLNLSVDKLEDYFRRASQELLPSGSVPVLPEAFLTFPHPMPNARLHPENRRQMQSDPQKIYQKTPSFRDIKKQLKETAQ